MLKHTHFQIHLLLFYDWAIVIQSVPSWLEIKLARAKKLKLGWLGSETKSKFKVGSARACTSFEFLS